MSHVNDSKGSAVETGDKGEFKRKESAFRKIVKKGSDHPPEGLPVSSVCANSLAWGLISFGTLKEN